jgi:hypothetical protein
MFHVVFGGTNKVVYDVGFGKESLSGSISMSSMNNIEGMCCLARRGGYMNDGDSDMGFFCLRD